MTCLSLLEDEGLPRAKTHHLTTENRIPGSVTPFAFITAAKIAGYEAVKGVFAIHLDLARDVSCCRPLVSAPGGRNLSIVAKARDPLLRPRIVAFLAFSKECASMVPFLDNGKL